MSTLRVSLFLLLLSSCAASSWAGGPFKVNGEGEPMAWAAGAPIHYRPDQGSLGQLDNVEARALLAEAFDVWAATGVVSFVEDPAFPVDVDVTNVLQYVFCSAGEPCRTDGLSPIVFDADGSIIDAALYAGARFDLFGLGGVQTDTATDPTITEGAVIINGAFFDGRGPDDLPPSPADLDPAAFKAVLVHEIGHYLNLDHSALNGELAGDGDPDNDIYLPSMYPISSDDDAALATLNPDDEAALRGLYAIGPVTGIHGRVQAESPQLPETLHFQGANVVLRRTGDPLMTAYSTVSGALFFPCEPGGACYPCSGACAANPTARGEFGVDFIEPGDYTVCVEQLDTRLHVGPLDLDGDGEIDEPRPIVPGPEECYDLAESALAADDDPDQETLVDAESVSPVVVRLNDLPLVDPFEATDTPATPPVPLVLTAGHNTVGAVLGAGDVDHYAIELLVGDRLRVDVDAQEVGYLQGAALDAVVGLYDPNDELVNLKGTDTFVDDSVDPDSVGDSVDPAFEITVGFNGTATLAVSSNPDRNFDGDGGTTTGAYWLRVVVDRDADGDGVVDRLDRCPLDPADDVDDDGICGEVDICAGDSDPDGDGVQGPCIVEPGWALTRAISFVDPIGAHYNPRDDKIYVGRWPGTDRGLYRIEADGSAVALWTGDDIASVLIDPADGDVFTTDDFSGVIYRTPFGSTVPGAWVAGFHTGDDDPIGMALAPASYSGAVLAPGQALVVDRGNSGLDEVWRWSPAVAEGEASVHTDNGTLVNAVDVAIDNSTVWVVDPAGAVPGVIYTLAAGTLTPFATSQPIREPSAIAIDPREGDLLVLDAGTDGGTRSVMRIDRVTGQVSSLFTQFDLSDPQEWTGLDVTPGGSALIVTDRAAGRIYVFERDRDGDGMADGGDLCAGDPGGLQSDVDADGFGNACDTCPLESNPQQRVRLDQAVGPWGSVIDRRVSPDGTRFVYVADQDLDEVYELYSVPITGGTPAKLSGTLVAGGDVLATGFEISPDSSRVVYLADQDTDGVFELYSVPLAGGAAVKLNGNLVPGRSILSVRISPNSSRVIYVADQDTDEVFELYSALLAGGVPAVKLNGALVVGGDVFEQEHVISPNSSRVVYLADQSTDGVAEIYSVPIAGGAAVKLNGTFVAGVSVAGYSISPNSSRVIYWADQATNDVFELYSAPLAGGAAAVKLNGSLVVGGAVTEYSISPDSSRVVYRADQDINDDDELYSAPLAGGAAAVQLNADGTTVSPFFDGDVLISPNSSHVVYLAEQNGNNIFELYSVPLAGGAVPVKLNGSLFGILIVFDISPDSSRVIYRASQDTGNRELYSAPLAGGVPAVKLNDSPMSGNLLDFDISPDSSRVVYTILNGDSINELYSVPVAGGAAVKLNGALISEITDYLVAPDSSRVLYQADEDTPAVHELYSLPITGGARVKLSGTLAPGRSVGNVWFASATRVVYDADEDMGDLGEEYYSVELHGDRDADGVSDSCDRCPVAADPAQADHDGDGFGDACDICPFAEQQQELSEDLSWTDDPVAPATSPDGATVVFIARDGGGPAELFRVSATGGPPVRLNDTLVSGGGVVDFRIAPDGSRVVYLAAQTTNNVVELYSVPLAGGGAAIKLNDTLVSGGDVGTFGFAPDSSRVIYRADQTTNDVFELYSAPLAGGEVVIKLNATLVSGGDVVTFRVAPNSSRVVYLADQGTNDVFEVYSAPLAGGEAAIKLNDTLVSGGSVVAFDIAPNSSRVVYAADQGTNDVFELYSVGLAGGAATKISGTLVSGGDVTGYSISPDSSRVVFVADQDADDVFELYSVLLAGGAATKISGTLVSGGDVADPSVSPDSSRVVFLADRDTDGVDELYSVALAGGTVTKISGTLTPGGDVFDYSIAPNSSRVAYRADQDTDAVDELYSVLLAGGVAPTKLNGPLALGGDVSDYVIAADSSTVAYLAQQDTENSELYSVPLAGGTSSRISVPLAAGGSVQAFVLTDDSSRALYWADEAGDGVLELFTTQVPDDLDADSIAGFCDVCPLAVDPDQRDADLDGLGDACDICPLEFNPEQRPVKLNGVLVANGDVATLLVSPSSSRVTYVAPQDTSGVDELYSVPLAGGTPAKLNGALGPGQDVVNHVIAPNSSHAIYLADQDTDGVTELYSVPLAGGAAAVKLNDSLTVGGDVMSVLVSSTRAVYLADQDTDGVNELYSAPLAGGATPTKLNDVPVLNGDVNSFAISPDSARVVYLADQDTDDVVELYSVPLTGGSVTRLNDTLVVTGEVTSFAISPDSARVVYLADQDTDDVVELYSVPIAGGVPVKLNLTLVTGNVVSYRIAPDSSRVVYLADQDTDNVFELYSVALAGGTPVKLNGVLVSGGGSSSIFAIAPDSSRVVYLADQDTDDVFELYSVPLAGGAPVKLNGVPVTGGDASTTILISPDSARVVYRADLDADEVFELYSVPLMGGTEVKLNGVLPSGGDVSGNVFMSPDGASVVYRADQVTDEVFELYAVPIAGGLPLKLNGPLVSGGDVSAGIVVAASGARVAYLADQDADNVIELYSVALHDDADADGIAGFCDVCPDTVDPTQGDADGDGVGDACDNCPVAPNPTQAPCPPDETPPYVISFLPPGGSGNVALSARPQVFLSEPIDPATATTASFFVESGGVKVPGSVAVGGNRAWLEFNTEGTLEPGTDYTVHLTHDLRDLAGMPADPDSATFHTLGSPGSGALPVGTVGQGGPGGLPGAQISGSHPGDHAGFSVAVLGDVNGGGAADLLSGAPYAGPGGLARAGSVMLVFGETALQSNATAAAARRIEYLGEEAEQQAGWAVARAGDLNGDQKADLLIGAPYSDANGDDSGRVYVVFGHDGLDELAPGALELSALADCSAPTLCGVVFEGAAADDRAGAAISWAGDLNGDQQDDLLIGAPGASPAGRTGAGKVYLIHGPLTVPPFNSGTPIDLATVGSLTPGLVFHGEEEGDHLGAALSAWIDTGVGGTDGHDDFLVGAPGARVLNPFGGTIPGAGIVYAVRGGRSNLDLKAEGGVIELSRTPGDVFGFLFLGALANTNLGSSLTGAIDADADGQPDIYIGGSNQVLFVSGNGPKTVTGNSSVSQEGGVDVTRRQIGPGLPLTQLGVVFYTPGLDGSPGPLVVGPGGDVNDDGIEDVVIGAPGADPPGPGGPKTNAGKAYIVYGSAVQSESEVLLSDVGIEVPGLALEGAADHDELGYAVGGGFDVNGDEIDDALVGAPGNPVALPNARGEGYVVSPVAPDEVELLRLAKIGSTARLEWTPPHRALGYNVYRGLLSAVRTAGEVRTSDVVPAFECGLDQDGTVAGLPPDASDAATPPPGAAFVYLVTARNRIGEGPLGPPGDPRINDEQCP